MHLWCENNVTLQETFHLKIQISLRYEQNHVEYYYILTQGGVKTASNYANRKIPFFVLCSYLPASWWGNKTTKQRKRNKDIRTISPLLWLHFFVAAPQTCPSGKETFWELTCIGEKIYGNLIKLQQCGARGHASPLRCSSPSVKVWKELLLYLPKGEKTKKNN